MSRILSVLIFVCVGFVFAGSPNVKASVSSKIDGLKDIAPPLTVKVPLKLDKLPKLKNPSSDLRYYVLCTIIDKYDREMRKKGKILEDSQTGDINKEIEIVFVDLGLKDMGKIKMVTCTIEFMDRRARRIIKRNAVFSQLPPLDRESRLTVSKFFRY